jgi:chorismate synthase
VAAARKDLDSVGGIIECAVTGLPVGLGEPMFGGMESRIAQIVYGIPAVKGLEFGAGFDVATMRGSENNDSFTVSDGKVSTLTNHAGGILGGITNAMPLIFRVAVKPTPSIAQTQQTVSQGCTVPLEIKGRHDPCIAPRAVPVVEAAAAIAIFDAILSQDTSYRRVMPYGIE